MPAPFRLGLNTFRTLNGPLSGELHVVGGFSRCRGARSRRNQANTPSRAPIAGPVDGGEPPEGGSAHHSGARSSGRPPDAGSASGGSGGVAPKRAPIKGHEQWSPFAEHPENELQPIAPLPRDAVRFVKAVNRGAQIVGVAQALLKSDDPKIQLRVLELMVDLGYPKASRSSEEDRQRKTNWSIPRPDRD